MTTPNERLRQVRLEMNLKQGSFAKMLDLMQGSYSDIERGKVNISSAVREKITKLGISLDFIDSGKGSMFVTKGSTVKSRILSVFRELGVDTTPVSLSGRLSARLDELSFLYETGGEPSPSFLEKFFSSFPQVNKEWILDESGTPYNLNLKDYELLSREVAMLRDILKDKEQIIEDKSTLISTLYKQIKLMESLYHSGKNFGEPTGTG